MSGSNHNDAPQRLAGQEGPLGRLLSDAAEATGEVPAGARARVWRGLQAPAKPLWARPAFAIPGLAAACAAALLLFWARPAPAPVAPAVALSISVVDGAIAAASPSGAALPAGAALPDGTSLSAGAGGALLRSGGAQVALSAGAHATLKQAADGVEVWLDSGEAAVGPADGAPAALARVSMRVVAAGAFRVEAPPGALFVVSASAVRSVVYAVRGDAQVRSSAGLAPLAAGASWSSAGAAPAASESIRSLAARAEGQRAAAAAPSPAAEAIAQPAPVAVAPEPAAAPVRPNRLLARAAESAASQGAASDEAALARANALEAAGDNAGAAAAFEELSHRSGPRAEAALYELGRLRLRFLGQPAQALAAFEEHARRFPSGALSLESGLSAVEARLALGQDDSALREMDSFLGRYGESERAGDVLWLRASLLQGRGDCRRALPDLRTLAAAGSRAEGALFLLATCAGSGGDLAETRARLVEYQQRFPDGAHRAEVDAALAGGDGR